MKFDLECPECGVSGPHQLDGDEATCEACWVVRTVEPELLEAVVEVERCDYCRQTLPVGHECSPDPTPCLRKTGLWPCGTCEACLAAQERDLAEREQALSGSPSDLYPS